MGQFELMKNKKRYAFLQEHLQDPFYKRKFAKCIVFYCSFVDYAKAELLQLNRTQFPSLEILVSKKSWKWKKLRPLLLYQF